MKYKSIRKPGSSVTVVHIESVEKVQISFSYDHTDEPPFLERVFPVGKENAAAVLHSGWLVECAGEETAVLCTRPPAPLQCIRLSFESGKASIVLTADSEEHSFSNVQSLEIREQQIIIALRESGKEADEEAETEVENTEECNDIGPPAVSREGVEDIIPMALHLQELRKKDKIIEELTHRSRKQAEDNRQLQVAMSGNLENIIRIINDNLRLLSEEGAEAAQRMMAKIKEREDLSSGIKKKEAEISAVESEIRSLRRTREEKSTQLVKKNGIREALELDCERISQLEVAVEALTLQLSLDRETIEALEDTTELSGNRLQDTIEDIHRKIEAVEKRIGRIVRLREALAGKIDAAVLNRDRLNGWILLDDLRKEYRAEEDPVGTD